MKIIHVVPHINDEAAGPSYSVPRLCQSQAALGHSVTLSCLAAGDAVPGVTLDIHPEWSLLKRFAVSPAHALALHRQAAVVDIVHNHSLWSMVNVAAGWVVPGRGAKLVTSPRGTLSPWALSLRRSFKRLLWPLQRRALFRADLLHATSDEEYRQIRAMGLTAPVAIIPNGIDLPPLPVSAEVRPSELRTLLYLGRIHPTKCIDRLLEAWAQLQTRHAGWQLVIAGKGDPAFELELHKLAESLQLQRVEFVGPLYGAAKSRAYFDADLFVLPTHSENFGMVVAEALAHGCPAVVSQGAPWAGLSVEGCGWWVPNDVASISQALDEALQLPAGKLAEMGSRGREWMLRDYSWESVAQRMLAAYSWLLSGGVCPSSIKTD